MHRSNASNCLIHRQSFCMLLFSKKEYTVIISTSISVEHRDDGMEEACLTFQFDACQGWIRHARGFYPRCLAIGLWCWWDSLACPRPKTGCWGKIIFVVVVWCIVLYSIKNKCANVYTLCICIMYNLRFCRIVLNLSQQCVRLCCTECVFEGLCVISEGKVCF